MGRIIGRLRKTWAPASVVGMLALVMVVEWGLGRRERDLTTMWAAAWAEAGRAAAGDEAKGADILFFGDSQVMQGVAPKVVERESGRRAYNLAVFNGMAPSSYFLLKRAVESGARPSAVCIDGGLLWDDPKKLTRLWPELLDAGELIDLAATMGDAEYGLELLLAKALPSVKMRHEVRAAAEGWRTAGDRPANRHVIAHHVRHWRVNAGAHVRPADQIGEPDADGTLVRTGYAPGWSIDRANAAYVERFLALAEAKGSAVYWLIPPVRAEVQTLQDRGGLSAGYEGYLRGLQARFSRLVVLDGRRARYPREALADLTHLNRTGTCVFSAGVGEALARGGEERWVTLPEWTGMPSEGLLAEVEDFRETGRVLRAAGGRERMQR